MKSIIVTISDKNKRFMLDMEVPTDEPGMKVTEDISYYQALSGENIQVTETRRGIDGKMSAGVITQIVPVTITLEANSPTLAYFKAIAEYQEASKKLCPVTLTVSTPSIGETTIFTNGVLQTAPSMANINRTLEATQWVFHFESKAAIPL